MANYVAHYTKKLETLARKKLALKRLLSGQSKEEVTMAAQAVRESQIRALEAKKAQIPPCEVNADRIRAIHLEIETCRHMSVAEIVESCSP